MQERVAYILFNQEDRNCVFKTHSSRLLNGEGVFNTIAVNLRVFVDVAPSKSPPVGETLAAVAFDFFKVLPTGEDLGGALIRCKG